MILDDPLPIGSESDTMRPYNSQLFLKFHGRCLLNMLLLPTATSVLSLVDGRLLLFKQTRCQFQQILTSFGSTPHHRSGRMTYFKNLILSLKELITFVDLTVSPSPWHVQRSTCQAFKNFSCRIFGVMMALPMGDLWTLPKKVTILSCSHGRSWNRRQQRFIPKYHKIYWYTTKTTM